MTALDVIARRATWSAEKADAVEFMRRLPSRSVALVFFSPPYTDQRTYSIGFAKRNMEWVEWMRRVVFEACRVSAGLVVVNAAGPVRQHVYQPVVEWLVADLTRRDGIVCGPSPYAWVKQEDRDDARPNGISGSGSKHSGYHRRDWEPVYAFALPDRLPLRWHDHLAFGYPPAPSSFGGEFSNRTVSGRRANEPGPTRRRNGVYKAVKRGPTWRGDANGAVKGAHARNIPAICNPGNVIRVPVGGGKLGHRLAHDNEAPMALGLAERFVCWFARPGETVLDPFVGSGTTAHAALLHGRRFVGCDARLSQVKLTRRRLAEVFPAMAV